MQQRDNKTVIMESVTTQQWKQRTCNKGNKWNNVPVTMKKSKSGTE